MSLIKWSISLMGLYVFSGCSWQLGIIEEKSQQPNQQSQVEGSHVTSWSNGTAGTTVTASIPTGYYESKMCSFQDLNLTTANIANGVSIFGVTGAYTGTFAMNMASSQHRDKSIAQVSLSTESVTNAGTAYVNSAVGYRAVTSIMKDDDGYLGTSVTAVNRTGWGATTCGTAQATIELRIADCAAVFLAEATWDGSTKGNSGQGVWKLVTRTGDITAAKGREVWRDERTKLLWSSRLGAVVNWCRASGSNNITNNPAAEADPGSYCDGSYQNTGTGPATKAISACFEDGDNYFTTSHASIDNAGKVGLGLSSVPSVAWRLPTLHDYMQAEANGIRFALPDMLANGAAEWTSTAVSGGFHQNAWRFVSNFGYVDALVRYQDASVRCVGR